MIKKYAAIALATALVCPSAAIADTVTFKNQDRISGAIIDSQDPRGLQFRSSYGQTFYIPWDTIDNARDAQNNLVPLKRGGGDLFSQSGSIAQAPRPSEYSFASDPKPSINNFDAPAQIVSAAPAIIPAAATTLANAVTDTKEEDQALLFSAPTFLGALWHGRVDAGAGLQEGNSDTENFNLDGKIGAEWNDIHRATITAELNKETDNDIDTEDNKSIDGAYDYFFAEKWFANTTLGFEQDDVAELDLRTDAGIGLGYQPFKSDPLNLQMTLGPSYLGEEFSNGNKDEALAYRWGLDYDQKIAKELFQIFHNHNLLAPSDDTNAFILETETGIRMPIRGGIVGSLQLDFDRDNDPAPGIDKDDTQYSLKLGYEW